MPMLEMMSKTELGQHNHSNRKPWKADTSAAIRDQQKKTGIITEPAGSQDGMENVLRQHEGGCHPGQTVSIAGAAAVITFMLYFPSKHAERRQDAPAKQRAAQPPARKHARGVNEGGQHALPLQERRWSRVWGQRSPSADEAGEKDAA